MANEIFTRCLLRHSLRLPRTKWAYGTFCSFLFRGVYNYHLRPLLVGDVSVVGKKMTLKRKGKGEGEGRKEKKEGKRKKRERERGKKRKRGKG